MIINKRLSRIAVAVAMSVGLAAPVMAQETTSSIRGTITGPQGNPAAGTEVTVTHLPSGTTKQVVVGANGQINLSGLRVGGPYQIILDSDKFEDALVTDIFLSLGEPALFNFQLAEEQAIEKISVTASQVSSLAFGQQGPGTVFSLEDLENAPSVNRDIKDVIRADPRIYIDESFSDAVQCAGASPRFNSLTLDGMRLNDNFGLNSNGYPTEAMPFSYSAIEQVAVELAPFDVQYGGFTACNINAVTKSGTNDFSGSVFFDYTSDSFKGDEVDGREINLGDYTEERYGVTVGFPLIKDELFFFGAYEKKEGVRLHNYNFSRVEQSELDQIAQISRDVYGYDPGGFKGSSPVTDEKIIAKIDWNINDDHRASLVYNWNDGFTISESDSGSTRVSFDGHFYERGAEVETTVLSLFSDWTDDFSTELRIGNTTLDNRQISVDAATGFGEVQIRVPGGATVYLGPDDSRQANDLNWEADTFKLAGTYYHGDHTITAGVEYENLNVFNLFMQHRIGEYRFNSIEDFANGTPARIYYNNAAGTNDPNDVAASFEYANTTFYIQDKWNATDDLILTLGLRYDKWTSDDRPVYNSAFEADYGYANTNNLDGISLVQPRIGFNYTFDDQLEVRGGFGIYSGGNPNVWVSNAYSNNGVVQVFARERNIPDFDAGTTSIFDLDLVGGGNPIYSPAQALYDYVADFPTDGSSRFVVAIDPDYDMPSEEKYALGFTYLSDQDYLIQGDLLYTKKRDAAIYLETARTQTGTAPDGRPVYSGSNSTYILSNVDGNSGDATTLSLAVSKEFDNGIDMTFAYAYNDSKDVNPMTSSVAGSNYNNFATFDPNNPGPAVSNYNIPNRFTLNLSYSAELIAGYDTRFSMFATANEGRGMSYTFEEGIDGYFGDGNANGRQLVYIPTENDANVVYGPDFDLDAFNAFIASEGLDRGEIMRRNSVNGDWWTKVDVRISQELPAFHKDHRASAFFVIENLGNLLNDEWGVLKQGNFVSEEVVEASVNDAGQYVYEAYLPAGQRDGVVNGASQWEVRVGVNYRF